jgi:Skp family chaperone for outer membrane proteins
MEYVTKYVGNCYILAVILAAVSLVSAQPTSEADKRIAMEFEQRARNYTERREAIEETMPKLSKQATAEEIAAHKAALLQKVLAERKGVARGSIFTPEAERYIRSVIATLFKGRERVQLRKELSEAENASVPVKVSAVYPEAAELLEMPPTLLLALPPLPKQLRYRFVGASLLLVDRENHLIVDHMTNALP